MIPLPVCTWTTTIGGLRAMGLTVPASVDDDERVTCTSRATQHPDCSITHKLTLVVQRKIAAVDCQVRIGEPPGTRSQRMP